MFNLINIYLLSITVVAAVNVTYTKTSSEIPQKRKLKRCT